MAIAEAGERSTKRGLMASAAQRRACPAVII
jgi:hypothetical protein